jgi:hypothetical protein
MSLTNQVVIMKDCLLALGTMQLYTATLDNTGNNNTTCKTIERIHNHRGLEWNSKERQLPYDNNFYNNSSYY